MHSRKSKEASGSLPELSPSQRAVIGHLYRAYQSALQRGEDEWQYAEELPGLRAVGVSHLDLRCLLLAGLIAHGVERPTAGKSRCFQQIANLSLPESSCFVLTDRGKEVAQELAGTAQRKATCPDSGSGRPKTATGKVHGSERTTPTLVLTGERLADRFRVVVQGKQVHLTRMTFRALLSLILARLETETGFVALKRIAVSLLRRHCDEGIAAGAGRKLIETGFRQEYRLSVPRDELAIVLERSFAEVETLGVIPRKQFGRLLRTLGDSSVLRKSD